MSRSESLTRSAQTGGTQADSDTQAGTKQLVSAASAGLDPESESGPDFKFNVKLAGGAQSDSERAGKPVGPVTGGAPPRGRGAAPSPGALRRLSRTEQERHSVVRFPCQPGGTRSDSVTASGLPTNPSGSLL